MSFLKSLKSRFVLATNPLWFTAGSLLLQQLNLISCIASYSDTVSRSGMFCAIVTTIERCKTEGVVDVFQVVKALRVQKPGAVPTVVSDHSLLICTSVRTVGN